MNEFPEVFPYRYTNWTNQDSGKIARVVENEPATTQTSSGDYKPALIVGS